MHASGDAPVGSSDDAATEPMRIRPLTPGDAAFLRSVLYHAIYVPPGHEAPPPAIVEQPELARYAAAWMRRPGDLGFAAEQGGRRIGAAWLRRWSSDDHGFGFVDEATPELSMALLPGYRGRGVGTRLLRHLVAAAEARYAAVSLSVSAANPARRLYERAGFVAMGDPERGSITMIKRLVPRDGV